MRKRHSPEAIAQALRHAEAGARVVLAGRDPSRAQASIERIRAVHPAADVCFEPLDLADLASVRAFAQRMMSIVERVDLLVNNAGVKMLPRRRMTADGFEMQFGTNFLGHFALTGQLLPLLSRVGSRVVNVSSSADNFGRIPFDDPQRIAFTIRTPRISSEAREHDLYGRTAAT